MTTMHGGVKPGYSVLIEMQKGLKSGRIFDLAGVKVLYPPLETLFFLHYRSKAPRQSTCASPGGGVLNAEDLCEGLKVHLAAGLYGEHHGMKYASEVLLEQLAEDFGDHVWVVPVDAAPEGPKHDLCAAVVSHYRQRAVASIGHVLFQDPPPSLILLLWAVVLIWQLAVREGVGSRDADEGNEVRLVEQAGLDVVLSYNGYAGTVDGARAGRYTIVRRAEVDVVVVISLPVVLEEARVQERRAA